MRAFRYTVILIVLFSVYPVFGKEVTLRGGTVQDRESLHKLIKNTDYESVQDTLRAFLSERGYFDAVISADRQNIDVKFGSKYIIGNVIIRNGLSDTLAVNEAFEEAVIERIFQELLRAYQEKGYFYANLQPMEFVKRDSLIDIFAQFQTGPLLTISEMEFKGLKKTDPNHVAKYIDLRKGDTLNYRSLQESVRQLRRLDYLSLDSPPDIVPEEGYDRARIVFNFSERNRVSVEGSGGYVPEDDGYFMWYFNGRLRNIFGQGRFIELHMDRRERDKSIFRTGYKQPLFLFGRGVLGLAISTRDYRDQFYEFGIKTNYDLNLSTSTSLGFGLEWKDVEPESASLPSYNIYGISLSLRSGEVAFSNRLDFQSSLHWQITYLSRQYDINREVDTVSNSTYDDTRIDLVAEISKKLLGSLHGYGKLLVRDVESSETPLPSSEVILFGGPGTLRGYRNDQFSARRLFTGSLEPHLFWDNYSYLFPFIDLAYYELYRLAATGSPVKFDDFLYGFGVGARIGSSARSLAISLSWGEDTAPDEPRLNITIADQF